MMAPVMELESGLGAGAPGNGQAAAIREGDRRLTDLGEAEGSCPDENELVDLVEGRLPDHEVEALEAHLDGCSRCMELLNHLATVLASSTASLQGSLGDEAPEPRHIGRYQVRGVLGAGAMGLVYRAFDPHLRREVALKVIHPRAHSLRAREALRKRLVREARLLAGISHPNLVAVYDVGLEEDRVFVAMECVDGRTVRDWIRDEEPDWRGVLRVFREAGAGLAAAHRSSLVHRDVKPDNLLIGSDGRVRLTDFGLATVACHLRRADGEGLDKQVEPGLDTPVEGAQGAMTRTGTVVGTPAYMAPEQIAGLPSDAKADQFSFCVSIYEAIAGQRPFSGRTVRELARSIASAPPAVSPLAGVPRRVRQAILRGLRPEPSERFASMDELLSRLDLSRRERLLPVPSGPLLGLLGAGGVLFALLLILAAWPRGPSVPARRTGGSTKPLPLAMQPGHAGGAGLGTVARARALGLPPQQGRQAQTRARGGTSSGRMARQVRLPADVVSPGGASASMRLESGNSAVRAAGGMGLADRDVARVQKANLLRQKAAMLTQRRLGKPCLRALDAADRLDPAGSRWGGAWRAMCEMLVGRCARGRSRYVRFLRVLGWRADRIKSTVDKAVQVYCRR